MKTQPFHGSNPVLPVSTLLDTRSISQLETSPELLRYSRFKLGLQAEVEWFSKALTRRISGDLESDGNLDKTRYAVVSIAGHAIPKIATVLGHSISQKLALPYEPIIMEKGTRPTHWRNYSKSTPQARQEMVQDKLELTSRDQVCGKRVILVDDMLVTGAMLRESHRVLRQAGASQVLPYVIISFSHCIDHTVEYRVNELALKKEGSALLVRILQDPRSIFSTRLLSSLYSTQTQEFKAIIDSLSAEPLLRLYLSSLYYFGKDVPYEFNMLAVQLGRLSMLSWPDAEQIHHVDNDESFAAIGMFLNNTRQKLFLDDYRQGLGLVRALVHSNPQPIAGVQT